LKSKIDKVEANILLASTLGSQDDFQRLLQTRNWTESSFWTGEQLVLDASPSAFSGNADDAIPVGVCAKVITPHAAAALSSIGINCLDIRDNSLLVALPVIELCSIGSLKYLQCYGCTSLKAIPQSVAKDGGRAAMKALDESLFDVLLGPCVTPARVQELPSARVSDFGSMLDDPTRADVTFVVNNERIHAHRNILAARLPYFRTMFSSGMKEAQEENDIIVKDTSPMAFRALLLYLYTDELAFDDSVKLLVDVLRKAKELDLTRVYNHCEQRCQRGLSAQNAALLFSQADEYALDGLRESALRYLSRNFSTIRADCKGKAALAKLATEKPILMAEVIKASV
jgi:hypothetical protein